MNVGDDLFFGPDTHNAFQLAITGAADPTIQNGCGPMGRVAHLTITPTTLGTTNVGPGLQSPANGVPLTLVAGAGTSAGVAPGYSVGTAGSAVVTLDTPRAVSLTSTGGNFSGINFLVKGFDLYGQAMSQLLAGPAGNATVNTTKAFKMVQSVTPQGTVASATLGVGTSDIFGLPFRIIDAGYIVSVKWNNTLADNAATFVAADQTNPATSSTGDTRGTIAQAGAASNGSRILVVCMHLDGHQCGQLATLLNAIGVPQA